MDHDFEERQAWDWYCAAVPVAYTADVAARLADERLVQRRKRFPIEGRSAETAEQIAKWLDESFWNVPEIVEAIRRGDWKP